tara:strand:+ start:6969 stop:8099 length:1131 start_codon:yes stop_codon:yes gene_type:complete
MKQIKILVVPNITNSRDVESDSFFDVLFQQISQLGNGFYWFVAVKKESKRLKRFLNVEQIPIDISGNMFHMRVNFPLEMIKLLQTSTLYPNNKEKKYYVDYDIVYSHMPDWSVRRYVPSNKKIIGYSHWWEMSICNGVSNFNNYLNFEREILGALQMEVLFVNTLTQKKIVIEESKKTFNDKIILDLERIIQPYYLSVAKSDLVSVPQEKRYKTIVYNHRIATYKGFPKFYKWIKEFRDYRTDFDLWITLSQTTNKKFSEEWIDTSSIENKKDYLERLSKSLVCVVPIEKHYAWSISATDSMMCGTPTLFEECENYREINSNGLFYNSKKELFSILDRLLDDKEFVYSEGLKSLNRAVELSNNENINVLKRYLSNI